jgi:hypothetical protein
MPVTQFFRQASDSQIVPQAGQTESFNWLRAGACGALVAGGLLLLGGKRKSGLVLSVTGTALALVEQPETLRSWWESLPRYLEGAEHLIGEVQGAVGTLGVQRDKIREVFQK